MKNIFNFQIFSQFKILDLTVVEKQQQYILQDNYCNVLIYVDVGKQISLVVLDDYLLEKEVKKIYKKNSQIFEQNTCPSIRFSFSLLNMLNNKLYIYSNKINIITYSTVSYYLWLH